MFGRLLAEHNVQHQEGEESAKAEVGSVLGGRGQGRVLLDVLQPALPYAL